jgi:hypothetical protein
MNPPLGTPTVLVLSPLGPVPINIVYEFLTSAWCERGVRACS